MCGTVEGGNQGDNGEGEEESSKGETLLEASINSNGVVNVVKGFQAQTNECLVIGEITTDKMIVVLNKVDLLPEEERARKIEEETRKIKERLSKTCFADAPIVAVSAHVGGMGKDDSVGKKIETIGVDKLIDTMRSFVELPDRSNAKESELFFSVDHCFQIKGQGTVLTGTF